MPGFIVSLIVTGIMIVAVITVGISFLYVVPLLSAMLLPSLFYALLS